MLVVVALKKCKEVFLTLHASSCSNLCSSIEKRLRNVKGRADTKTLSLDTRALFAILGTRYLLKLAAGRFVQVKDFTETSRNVFIC